MSFARLRPTWLTSLPLILLASVALAGPGDVGTPAADFSLPVFGGGTQTLSQHSGKVVLLFIIGYG